MPKTTKAERKALAAVEDAAVAARFAKQAAKTLPAKRAKKLRELADEAKDAAGVWKKSLHKHPARVTKRAGKAAERASTATESALACEQKKAAAKARKAAAEKVAKPGRKARDKSSQKHADAAPAVAIDEEVYEIIVEALEEATHTELVGAVIELEPEPTAEEPSEPASQPEQAPEPARTPAPRRRRASAAPAEDLGALTVAALRERARAEGRTGYSRLSKAQLVELLS